MRLRILFLYFVSVLLNSLKIASSKAAAMSSKSAAAFAIAAVKQIHISIRYRNTQSNLAAVESALNNQKLHTHTCFVIISKLFRDHHSFDVIQIAPPPKKTFVFARFVFLQPRCPCCPTVPMQVKWQLHM